MINQSMFVFLYIGSQYDLFLIKHDGGVFPLASMDSYPPSIDPSLPLKDSSRQAFPLLGNPPTPTPTHPPPPPLPCPA